ncbi:DUF2306 domain-containing protein [Rathayibacter sp. YIM 133350]|uniref:DUF2306 domain-containing protein n=1 Tax=Rathayibacter sp. YIM 133350 TaxID=3131992 RepID=UPI00307D50AD
MSVSVWGAIFVLMAVVLVFAGIRVGTDTPFLMAGASAESDSFEYRYVASPWLAYLHIVPGVLYLVGAPFQLSRRFRERHFTFHRRFGRILLTLGLTSGVFALAFGVPFSYGGAWQSLATAVFGSWFLLCLALAYRAIRRGHVRWHRRWMIRAFAVALGVGTIRLWVGLFAGFQVLSLENSFAPAFWLGLGMHVLAGEFWLWWRPDEDGRTRRSVSARAA